MIHHTCKECQRGFVAISYEEAQQEWEQMKQVAIEDGKLVGAESFDEAVEKGLVAYAQLCPYCGEENIEVV